MPRFDISEKRWQRGLKLKLKKLKYVPARWLTTKGQSLKLCKKEAENTERNNKWTKGLKCLFPSI